MRGWFACAAVALAACGENPGAYLTIKGSGLASVAVYVGDDACSDNSGDPCGIAPPTFDKVHPIDPGGTWFRDAKGAFTAGASGGVARVRIEPSGNAKTVQVIVLGLDAQGAPVAAKVVRDLEVPANDATSVMLTLDPATMFDGNPHASGTFVDLWADPAAVNDCVLVQSWDNGQAMDTFIVPEDDGDCDGVPTLDASGQQNAKECDPYWYMHGGSVATTEPDCAESNDLVGGHNACQLGGQACTDGMGISSTTCTREDTTTCVPSVVCAGACGDINSTTPFSMCGGAGSANITSIHCSIQRNDAGGPCAFTGATQGGLDLAPLIANPARTIDELEFANVDQLYGISNKLQKDTLFVPNSSVELDFAKRSTGGAFAYDVTWKNGTPFPQNLLEQWAVAEITLDNGNHMRLPIEVGSAQCGTAPAITCYAAVQSDLIVSCSM